MTPGSRSTGAGGTPPGPARSSRPWSARAWWSPAPTPPQWFCPTWPGSSSPCTPSGPMSPPRPVTLAGTRPHVPGPGHTCLGSGVPAAAVLAGRDPGQDLQAPEPSWPPTPGSLPSHAAPAHRSVARCVSHGGNKRLKRAMFPSAFASLRSDPVSRAYYQLKRDQGKPPWARPSSPWPTAAS